MNDEAIEMKTASAPPASDERAALIDHIARLAEHVRRLGDQVEQLGGKPCVVPPAREVHVQAKPLDFRELEQLRTELRVAQSAADEHLRQKAALRVQLNTISTQLQAARDEAARTAVKMAAQAAAATQPAPVTSQPAESPVKNPRPVLTPVRDLVLAFLRGRASSANARFIAERIGFSLTLGEVEDGIAALRKAGAVVLQDLGGTATWKAKA